MPTSSGDLYITSTNTEEIGLRDELYSTFYGDIDEVRKGQIGMLRRIRVDDDLNPIRCNCRDKVTDEPDKDTKCRFCYGMGWLWDERKLVYYKNNDAAHLPGDTTFYVEYSVEPKRGDYLVEVRRDLEGRPTVPLVREKLYCINEVESFRSDRGRIEYWRLKASLDKTWSVWYDAKPIRQPGAAS